MPFPLLFEAAVWPSVWPCLLVRAWSGMRLLFDRWSHDNQPRWASLDKPILCLRIPCVVSRTGVSFSRRLLPCSPPMVQPAPQWWRVWLCQTISQCLVVPGYARCDVGSEELLLGQQPSSSPLQLRGTFALVVCWLVEVGPLLFGGNWCVVLGLGWAARWPPYTGFRLISASMASTLLWRHVYIWSELPQQDERTCHRVPLADLPIAQVSSPVKPHCLWLAGVGRRL